jgi:hypothetical protein
MECKECGAPAEVIDAVPMNGVDYDGEEAIFEVLRVECAAGHRLNEVGGVIK